MLVSHPHDVTLTRFTTTIPEYPTPQSPKEIAKEWLTRLNESLSVGDTLRLSDVIHPTAWWRDHLALSWDLRTLNGFTKIKSYLDSHLSESRPSAFRLTENTQIQPRSKNPVDGLEWIEAMISFETRFGKGKGVARLVQGEDHAWKAYMIYTALQELRDHEELAGELRPHGGNNSLTPEADNQKRNWLERREFHGNFTGSDPDVLVVGAGQAGLNIAARLQTLSLSHLIIEKHSRIGDNWRCRYRTLVTHDPVNFTHMYGLPFPKTWPLFTPKDKLADWFEAYASIMELNVWLSCTLNSAEYSDTEHIWTVQVTRSDGSKRTLHPKHVVFCTGHSGEAKIPSFPGQENFQGTIYHASHHSDASTQPNTSGQRVVVVGTGNSGHDIAQNFYENGADVTMLQRSGTYVLRLDTGGKMMHKGMYDEHGPETEEADLYGQSLPLPVQFALNVGFTKSVEEAEKKQLDGLAKAGFEYDAGHDGSGILRKYVCRGGGYYIDIGASQLIVDGKINVVKSPEGITGFQKDGIVLADGRVLSADVVVLATGYDNMRTTVRKILGDKVADRAKDVWDLDDEGEINALWRPSGHPRLWFHAGNLAMCRIYSRFLALQIKATELGWVK